MVTGRVWSMVKMGRDSIDSCVNPHNKDKIMKHRIIIIRVNSQRWINKITICEKNLSPNKRYIFCIPIKIKFQNDLLISTVIYFL